MMRYKRESERDIEPMIEDGENIEINSNEEIESQGIYIYIEHMHVLLKLYIYLLISYLLFICKLIMYYFFEYVQMKSVSMMRC